MVPRDLSGIERRARRAYELSRLRRAVALAAPLVVLAGGAAWIGDRPLATAVAGLVLYLLGSLFLWRGQYAGRAVLPGVGAGIIPMAFALAARAFGHVCTGDMCVSLCVPACATGGFLAGVVISYFARRTTTEARSWACAGSLALLTGALGCSCVGYGGVAGLLSGLLITAVPALVRLAPARP
jgi:hypothetical protein